MHVGRIILSVIGFNMQLYNCWFWKLYNRFLDLFFFNVQIFKEKFLAWNLIRSSDANNGFCIFTMHAAKAKDFRYNLSEVLQGRILEK